MNTGMKALETALIDAERRIKEPALVQGIAGAIVAALGAAATLAAAYGFDMTSERGQATLTFIAALIPLVTILVVSWRTRNRVYSPATHGEQMAQARDDGWRAANNVSPSGITAKRIEP